MNQDKLALEGFIQNFDATQGYRPRASATDTRKPGELFKAMRADKTGTLKEAIQDIRELINLRGKLHSELTLDMDLIKGELSGVINQMPDEERKTLIARRIELDTAKVEEKLNAFRDIAKLKEELREHLKELRQQESRDNLIDNLLNEQTAEAK